MAFVLVLAACGDPTSTTSWSELPSSTDTYSSYSTSQTITADDYGLAPTIQQGEILHAWNWSMTNIKNALPEIAAAGYTAVQTSPMQPQKDYLGQQTWGEAWWKLYQPLGFSIATEHNAIGTKDELQEVCEEAAKYGIKIIVDVVANHLAGGTSHSFHPDVQKYEPEIYNQNLLHTNNVSVNDNSTEATVRGYLGDYPDLQTENPVVQNRVISLLKEYIDVGVDGFRFDAAKHIETPSDGQYASDFWPNVIGSAKTYNEEKGNDDLFIYGEILNNLGGKDTNRQISYYTPYMSFTDTNGSSIVRSNATMGHFEGVAKDDIFSYEGTDGSNVVMWAESHDTYANTSGETRHARQEDINKAYAIEASRSDFPSLYFARPTDSASLGEITTYAWQSQEITQVNKFHNQFVGSENHISTNDTKNVFLNEKELDGDYGAVIVTASSGDVTLSTSVLPDGEYTDQVTGNVFTVTDHVLTGEVGDTSIAVLFDPKILPFPTISVDNDGSQTSYEPFDVTITVRDADTAYYQIDNGEKVTFENTTTVTLGEDVLSGTIHLRVTAENAAHKLVKEYAYVKRDPNNLNIEVINIDNEYINDRTLAAWVWKAGEDGRWVNGNVNGNTFSFKVTINDTHFLLSSFPSGTVAQGSEDIWDQCLKQTADIAIGGASTFDAQSFTWKDPL